MLQNRDGFGRFLVEQGYRQGTVREQCELLAFACFKFNDKGLGVVGGRTISDGAAIGPCESQPERDDACCITLVSPRDGRGAGVLYHDEWPSKIFRYVLAHEIGHYLGLCHFGHDGFQSLMFTPAPEADLSYGSWNLLKFLLHDEPEFSYQDAKNVWRFLVGQMSPCLEGLAETEPVPATDLNPIVVT